MANLHESVEGAIQANYDNVSAFATSIQQTRGAGILGDIQRRGTSLPGDQGQNFGLHNQTNSPFGFGANPFNDFFGSRQTSNSFFGAGFGGGFGGGFGAFGFGGAGQGSLTGFSGNTRLAHFKMGSAVSAYKGFGIIKNVIDLMANFASEGLKIKHRSKNVEKFYNRWAEHVDLQGRIKDILRYYYKYGNVFIYMTPGIIDANTYDRMKRTKGRTFGDIGGFRKKTKSDSNDPALLKRLEDVDKEKEKSAPLREIPWRYTLLNPFQMDLRGDKFFGQSSWVFILDQVTATQIRNGGLSTKKSSVDFLDESKINLPPEFRRLAGQGTGNDARIVELDQARLWPLFYMKDDHEDWADPMIWPVMRDIDFKNKLRQMDISVCNSVINSITLFKIGDWKNGFIPPKEHFRKFAEFLRTPSAAMNMVWNDAVSIESSHPPIHQILGMQKYESVDRDILRGLGVPDTLIGGAVNSNFSTGFLGVRTLLERLEEGRNTVMRWLNIQLKMIAAIMGHRDIPRIRFGKMSLRDEKAEKQLIMGLLDRNIISIEAVLECFGEDFTIELERIRDEKKIQDGEGILIKHGPFTDAMSTMTDDEIMDREEEQVDKEAQRVMKEKQADRRAMRKMEKQSSPSKQNGRPPNSGGNPQQVQRETKPKGMAWVIEYEKEKDEALRHINEIDGFVTSGILQAKGKKYKKALSKIVRQGIEDITFVVASNIDTRSSVTMKLIQESLSEYSKMHRRTSEVYLGLITDGMSLSNRKKAMASAIALFYMEEK